MIKAAAGGGGRGIRKVADEDELESALTSSRREAQDAFGDGTVFMEAMVGNAHHIEVQLIADGQGQAWAAGVRDCSCQRRHQKVIEESSSVVLTPEQEEEVKEASRRLALQSGSFAFSDIGEHRRGPALDPVASFVNGFRERPGKPADRVFLSCGTYESLIYENRSIVPLFQSSGMEVRYVEARDGHNWENWRDRLREGLSWLLPGPFLMVYE